MAISIKLPLSIHEKGAKSNNEDNIFPAQDSATVEDRLFIVCDGVGGSAYGEIASRITIEQISSYFKEEEPDTKALSDFVQIALQSAEKALSEFKEKHPESREMATTLSLLYLFEDSALIIWVGDSKIYYFRDGKCLFESKNHSLVQELLDQGHISSEEAASHPQRNLIFRAIKGQEEATQADYKYIENLKPNDTFFLCSDGINENWSSEDLESLFEKEADIFSLKEKILEKSFDNTQDNFSAYFVKLDKKKEFYPIEKKSKNFWERIFTK